MIFRTNVYTPDGIVPLKDGGCLIQEGADNIDLNTETIDGKNSFHSMARTVFQITGSYSQSAFRQLETQRRADRSLEITEDANKLSTCLPFQKPRVKGVPKRVDQATMKISDCAEKLNKESDVLWVLLRSVFRGIPSTLSVNMPKSQRIPFWSGYYSCLSEYKSEYSLVSFTPIIDAKPSDMATVFTTMKKCSDMTNALGQIHSIQTFDQQLYAIAKQVQFAQPETFKTHILRLGGFHTLATFIASIGKLWGDGGLANILVDSSVYAAATTEQMLAGKQFNRGVRGLTLVYEALSSLRITAFFRWCEQNDKMSQIPIELWTLVSELASGFERTIEIRTKVNDLTCIFDEHFLPLFNNFRAWGCETSKTFKYWDMFIVAVEIMLNNIKAEREGLWDLHLASVSAMLPYVFTTNRVNYSRWLPVYILDMLNLPPDIKTAFESGQFAIRQKPSAFNGVWSDMAVEKTVIKDSKGIGGIVGITRQKSSLLRWSLTRHVLADFCSAMKSRSGSCQSDDVCHDETTKSALQRDNEHAQLLINHVKDSMTDPFDVDEHPDALINISTGMHASKDIENALLDAVDDGQKMAKTFIDKALTEGKNGNFYSPIGRSKLKTFEDMTKKTKLKCRSGETMTVHINPEMIFRRALILTNSRDDVTVEKLLSFPIGPIPTALFHDDGTMRKSCKSDICHQLESEVEVRHFLESFEKSSSVLIRDGMALLQSLNIKLFRTFGDLATHLIKSQLSNFSDVSTVVDVFDRYDIDQSIKACERERRCRTSKASKVFQVIEGRVIPDWKKFMGVSANKQALLKFFGEYIIQNHETLVNSLSEDDELYVAGIFSDPLFVKKVNRSGIFESKDLYSSHEEADTRMILHAIYADKQFGDKHTKGRIILRSPDTDVLVLAVHYFSTLNNTAEFWFQTGSVTSTKDNRRFIPVHEIVNSIHPSLCRILPAVHALTGCDTTSALFGIGKKSVYKILKSGPDKYSDLALLGSDNVDEALCAGRKFIARLYDHRGKLTSEYSDLNKLRARLATQKEPSLAKLPPCEATFLQHVLRSSLQTQIWTSSHVAQPPTKSPLLYGWEQKDGLVPIFFKGQMSSDFLQDLVCCCKGKKICSSNCVCFEQGLSCTNLCPCYGTDLCKNTITSSANILDDDITDT